MQSFDDRGTVYQNCKFHDPRGRGFCAGATKEVYHNCKVYDPWGRGSCPKVWLCKLNSENKIFLCKSSSILLVMIQTNVLHSYDD